MEFHTSSALPDIQGALEPLGWGGRLLLLLGTCRLSEGPAVGDGQLRKEQPVEEEGCGTLGVLTKQDTGTNSRRVPGPLEEDLESSAGGDAVHTCQPFMK